VLQIPSITLPHPSQIHFFTHLELTFIQLCQKTLGFVPKCVPQFLHETSRFSSNSLKHKTSTNQAPEEHTLGTEGESGIYYLELRRIADAGMVGFPNAGKSTLVSKLSHATPKIANYPFTTLNPMVGVVEFPKYRRCTVADIPGLIEGAHDNRGLGHEFLRHITRCKLLLFVIDMAGSEERNPIEDLEILRKEVKLYDEELAKFDWLVVANKMDLEGAEENLEQFRQRFPSLTIIPLSAETEDGIELLRQELDQRVGYRKDLNQA